MPDDFLGSDWMSIIVPQSIDNWPQLIEVNATGIFDAGSL